MTYILLVIAILSVVQRDANDRIAAVIFISVTSVYHICGDHIDGKWYYVVAGLIDLSLLYSLTRYFRSRLSILLSFAALVSLILNFAGWGLWAANEDPDPYNALYLLYYSWIAYIMLERTCGKLLKWAGQSLSSER